MTFPISTLKSEKELLLLVDEVKSNLDTSRVLFNYPEALTNKRDLSLWEACYKDIDKLNKDTLELIAKRSGVYAIYVAASGKEVNLMYVGQTEEKGSKQRIRSHIVWRNKNTKSGKYTGSKFDEVFDAVTSGKSIYISFCEVFPPSLRHYVEENLFKHVSNGWNIHGV